jgi:uncharacterized protein DUF397
LATKIAYKVAHCYGGNCVQVGLSVEGLVHVADTKDGGVGSLAFSTEEWTAFVADVKAGAFDVAALAQPI